MQENLHKKWQKLQENLQFARKVAQKIGLFGVCFDKKQVKNEKITKIVFI